MIDSMPLSELAREITAGSVRLAAATAAWLRLIAAFDERGGWEGVGIDGLDGVAPEPTAISGERFVGVEPIDGTPGRRPRTRPSIRRPRSKRPTPHRPSTTSSPVSRRPNRRTDTGGPLRRRPMAPARTVTATLYPDGEPPLPEAMQVNGERIDLAYVVGVLMGNRDLSRRLAAESGAQLTG